MGAHGQEDYNAWAESAFDSYVKAVDESRDYGAMNRGEANAVRLFGDPEHERILRKAWEALCERPGPRRNSSVSMSAKCSSSSF